MNDYLCEASQTVPVPFGPSLASIVSLLLDSCPSAVRRFVISIIIFAVKRMLHRRFEAHVVEKVLESINSQPTLADFNSPASIRGPIFVVLVVASTLHVRPSPVLKRFHRTTGLTMRARRESFPPQAVATKNGSRNKMLPHYGSFVAADAEANPIRARLFQDHSLYCESPELFSSEFKSLGHTVSVTGQQDGTQ
jgi:hypothetical protein